MITEIEPIERKNSEYISHFSKCEPKITSKKSKKMVTTPIINKSVPKSILIIPKPMSITVIPPLYVKSF